MNNRQIKFRVWDKTKKLMSPVARIMYADDGYAKTIMVEPTPYDSNYYRAVVDGENGELLQFTGLKDKNNQDIYEGDIVKFDYRGGWELNIPYHKGEIVFSNNENCIDDFYEEAVSGWYIEIFKFNNYNEKLTLKSLFNHLHHNVEIIGNIFQNPELLKFVK